MIAEIDMPSWLEYELVSGNQLWRFIVVLAIMLISMVLGRVIQFFLNSIAKPTKQKRALTAVSLLVSSMRRPVYVFTFAFGFYISKSILIFSDAQSDIITKGISISVSTGWDKIVQVLFAISVAYALFHLVDVLEYYLIKVTKKTDTTLDDMLVPVIRKSMRITIGIICILFVAENVFGAKEMKTFILGAGIGGMAIAFAAKDTIANLLGSIMIFMDRPFHINELVKIDSHMGTIEEVGFRSTKMMTLDGHMVTIPNSIVANTDVENIAARKLIKRVSNITITYDAGPAKAQKAVEIIKEILSDIAEVNTSGAHGFRVYFDDFNDWSLNIYMAYWVAPSDYWIFKEVNQRVNLEMMRRFEKEAIEFAFPSQTLYLKNDEAK
jgi:MscS family membrane protein